MNHYTESQLIFMMQFLSDDQRRAAIEEAKELLGPRAGEKIFQLPRQVFVFLSDDERAAFGALLQRAIKGEGRVAKKAPKEEPPKEEPLAPVRDRARWESNAPGIAILTPESPTLKAATEFHFEATQYLPGNFRLVFQHGTPRVAARLALWWCPPSVDAEVELFSSPIPEDPTWHLDEPSPLP